jgi:hypothetical protein
MCVGCPGESLYGSSQYIKLHNSDFIALQGINTMERLMMSDVRIPYKQVLKGRVILKPGQVNYLLNYLGLGDNATFLAIKATYNQKSVNKEDNYIMWNYYDNPSQTYPMAEMMVLTGSPTNRIKQLYLTNPSTKYSVVLDVMVAIIDDEYSFFSDLINQIGTSFTNLTLFNIETNVPTESIVIWDSSSLRNPLAYLNLDQLNSINRVGNSIIIDDATVGSIYLHFVTEYDAQQSASVLNLLFDFPDIIIQDLDPREDIIPPIVYFWDNLGGSPTASQIVAVGSTYSGNYDTGGIHGTTFSADISLIDYGYIVGNYSVLSKSNIIDLLVKNVIDITHGGLTQSITIDTSNITLFNSSDIPILFITSVGNYYIEFNITDLASNSIDSEIKFYLNVV